MSVYMISLQPSTPTKFSLSFQAGVLNFRLIWRSVPGGFADSDIDEGGWLMDVSDSSGNPIAQGIPLLPQQNLFSSYDYLGLPPMWIVNKDTPDIPPTYDNLGTIVNLFYSS